MAFSWVRNYGSSLTTSGHFHVFGGTAPIGSTIVRVIFGWSARLFIPAWQYETLAGQPVFAGAQTMRSGYGGALHSPAENPLGEALYPVERWLYWEASPLEPVSDGHFGHSTELILLRTSGTMVPRQSLTAVKNTYAAETLNVFVSADCPAVAAQGLEFTMFGYCSILYEA